MTDIEILREMIQESVTVAINDPYKKGNNQATLTEANVENNYEVTIYGLPDDVIIIKADAFPPPNRVFKGSKQECKRADFVIIANDNHKNVIICIEMKAGAGERKEIIQQLKGAKCVVAYCQEIGKMFWENKNFLNDYDYRYVSIRNISISKKPTRNSEDTIHDQPEKMLKISSQNHLQFKRLVERNK